VYEDPTYNEEYLLDGSIGPLAPADLLSLSLGVGTGRLHASKLPGPTFDQEIYIATATYINDGHATGMVIMASQLNNRVVGIGGWSTRFVQIDAPGLAAASAFNDTTQYPRVTASVAFPVLGVVVQQIRSEDSVYVTQLSSTFPNNQAFQRRAAGRAWENISATDVLPFGACQVEYRSLDAEGNASATAVLDIWVPRSEAFGATALPGSVRAQAQSCFAPSP